MSVIDRFFAAEASTKVVGVMRILAVLVMGSRFGAYMVPAFGDRGLDLALAAVFWVASGAALVGLFARPAVLVTGLCGMVVWYAKGVVPGELHLMSHHVYALSLLLCLLALTPCGRSFSVDRLRTGLPERAPRWGQWILAFQVTVLYLGAVYEKTSLAWLDGSRMQHFAMQIYTGSDLPEGAWFPALMAVSAVVTWVVELLLAVLIWVPRARLPILVVGFVFHGLVYVFTPVATFTTTMYVFLLAALDPDEVEAWLAGLPAVPEVREAPVGLVLVPLALLPLLRVAGLGLLVPRYEAFEDYGRGVCEVSIEYSGRHGDHAIALRQQDEGLAGVKRVAWRMCRPNRAVDLVGRCGSASGWEPVELRGWCEAPEGPAEARRTSAR